LLPSSTFFNNCNITTFLLLKWIKMDLLNKKETDMHIKYGRSLQNLQQKCLKGNNHYQFKRIRKVYVLLFSTSSLSHIPLSWVASDSCHGADSQPSESTGWVSNTWWPSQGPSCLTNCWWGKG
jgi:hypothetical protein